MNRSSQRQILSRPDIRTKNATAPVTSCRDPAAVMSTAVIQVPPSWYFGQGAGRNPGPGRRRSGTLTQTGHPCQPPNLRGPGTTGSRRCPSCVRVSASRAVRDVPDRETVACGMSTAARSLLRPEILSSSGVPLCPRVVHQHGGHWTVGPQLLDVVAPRPIQLVSATSGTIALTAQS